MENLNSAIPASPSSRLSRVFTNFNFFTPRENDLYNNNPINSFNDISELDHSDETNTDNFSLPATPAPRRKKMYQGGRGGVEGELMDH
ncbi:hypothetical protein QR98_0080460 [Sarcoptes scabiei]|nr:hypothetical protein QR98_0080460 [Sarcoptes scabiei]